MEAAQSTFISSTFWTERIGPTAGLKTLEIMEREKSWDQITKTGRQIGKRWQKLAQKHDLPLEISGLPALVNFDIPVENWLKYKTLITQEMLKKGYLAANMVYVCTEHTGAIIDEYFEHDHLPTSVDFFKKRCFQIFDQWMDGDDTTEQEHIAFLKIK